HTVGICEQGSDTAFFSNKHESYIIGKNPCRHLNLYSDTTLPKQIVIERFVRGVAIFGDAQNGDIALDTQLFLPNRFAGHNV
ncbi:MAG: hypothetical protein AB1Z20_11590, partial [Desulfobacterales bacterium]